MHEKNRLAAQERQRKAKAEALAAAAEKAEKSRMKRLLERKQRQMKGREETRRCCRMDRKYKLWNETIAIGKKKFDDEERHLGNFKKQNQKNSRKKASRSTRLQQIGECCLNRVSVPFGPLQDGRVLWKRRKFCMIKRKKMVTCPII